METQVLKQQIESAINKIEAAKQNKIKAVKANDFELAAKYRDEENRLTALLEQEASYIDPELLKQTQSELLDQIETAKQNKINAKKAWKFSVTASAISANFRLICEKENEELKLTAMYNALMKPQSTSPVFDFAI